jgi:hypothetical protein
VQAALGHNAAHSHNHISSFETTEKGTKRKMGGAAHLETEVLVKLQCGQQAKNQT